jgi:hypothetical protein
MKPLPLECRHTVVRREKIPNLFPVSHFVDHPDIEVPFYCEYAALSVLFFSFSPSRKLNSLQ